MRFRAGQWGSERLAVASLHISAVAASYLCSIRWFAASTIRRIIGKRFGIALAAPFDPAELDELAASGVHLLRIALPSVQRLRQLSLG